jgi:hypothetical protein
VIRSKIFILQFIIIAFIAIVHISALSFSLYWRFEWLDLVIHFLAGMWVALFSLWFLNYLKFDTSNVIVKVLIAVLAISIGWEIFELLAGIPREDNFLFDTSLDLAMDAVGAFAGFMTGKRLISQKYI